MSLTRIRQSLSRRLREEATGDDGFTVIEVLVAFTLIAVVTIGTVPLFISGLRAGLVSKLDTGGKNLNQERFEQMRTLAFHVDVNSSLVPVPANCVSPTRTDPRDGAGVTVCDYRDMLDTFYRSLTLATSTATGGYVPTGTARTADEPAIGAFYRYVLDPVPGFTRYKQTVATQFLTSERAPVAPGSTYNSQIAGYDFPPTRFVGVTVITSWTAGNLQKKFVAYSQIAEGRPPAAAVTMQARATAIRITSILPGSPAPQLKLEAGVSSADGALSSGATAATAVDSAVAEISGGGGRKAGKAGAAGAPPNFDFNDGGAVEEDLTDSSGVLVARFGKSDVRDVKANIVSEQPIIGDTSDPLTRQSTGRLRDTLGSAFNLGFNNRPDSPSPIPGLLTPSTTQMPVFMREPLNSSTIIPASGGTWIKAEAGSSHRARAGGQASTEFIKIFPTTFASDGVVQVKLSKSSLICSANGTASSAVADFEAQVRIWSYNPATGSSSYSTVVNIEEGQLISPLTDALLATQVGVNGTTPILLNEYIQSWGSITGAATTSGSGKNVNRSLNGIVSITTHPTRTGVPDSGIGLLIGILSCIAEDNR